MNFPKRFVMWREMATGNFLMTTRENYNAFVSDARKMWRFERSLGFLSFADALDCARQYCHICADDVEIITKTV